MTGEECTAGEIKIIFNYKGAKIGITSAGDNLEYLKPGFDELSAAECDILVCASRTKSSTPVYISRCAKEHGYTLVQMRPIFTNDKSIIPMCKDATAVAIKWLIDKLIDGK